MSNEMADGQVEIFGAAERALLGDGETLDAVTNAGFAVRMCFKDGIVGIKDEICSCITRWSARQFEILL